MLSKIPVLKTLGVLLICALVLISALFAWKLNAFLNPPLNRVLFWVSDSEYSLASRIVSGEDINKPTSFGVTPLHLAARWGEPSSVELLINNGANAFALDQFGQTTLFHAVDGGPIENIRIFLSEGVDVNKADKFGVSPLHKAVSLGNSEAIKGANVGLLIFSGAHLNSQLIGTGDTPLHWAANSYYPMQTLKPLLEAGADLNTLNYNGESALHTAAISGSGSAIELLLAHGADVSLRDKNSKTALDHALARERTNQLSPEVLKRLQ